MNSHGWSKQNEIQAKAIIQSIRSGERSVHDLDQRLKNLVESEIAKENPDLKLINLCEKLIWEITEAKPYEDDLEKSKQEQLRKFNKKLEKQRSVKRWCIASAAIAVVCAVGVLGYREWLSGQSSNNEQQFIVSGTTADLGIVHKGNADGENRESSEISTTKFEDIITFLGYEPACPTQLPKDVLVGEFWASRSFASDSFRIDYLVADGSLTYKYTRYFESETAQYAFEQNAAGAILPNKNPTVYCTKNIDDIVLVWFDHLDCYSLSGTLPLEVIQQMVPKEGR
ncbi:MAG: hypothetical protein RR696_08685 [Clostridia bacterium]